MGDVAVLDDSKDVGATNRRQLAALYCGATSGFEVEILWLLSDIICSLNILDYGDMGIFLLKLIGFIRFLFKSHLFHLFHRPTVRDISSSMIC